MSTSPAPGPTASPGARPSGSRAFRRLGETVSSRPRLVVGIWILLLVASLPLLQQVGQATTTNSVSLPASAPSSVAAAQLAREFPNATAASSALVLVQGANVTSAEGRSAALLLSSSILDDPQLEDVSGVQSLYSAYADYLAGQAELALGALAAALPGSPGLVAEVNESSSVLWVPAAIYLTDWQTLVNDNPGTSPGHWNYPAFALANETLSPPADAPAEESLALFYGAPAGFNGSADCAADPAALLPCSDGAVRATLAGSASNVVAGSVLATLDLENYTSWPSVRATAARIVAEGVGLPTGWVQATWETFPQIDTSATNVSRWATGVVQQGTVWTYPLPVPPSLYQEFVDRGNNLTLLVVDLSVSDDSPPATHDLALLNALVPANMSRLVPAGIYRAYLTGDVPLVVTEGNQINTDTDTILPITLLLLVGIMMVYFRSPLAPAVVMSTIGIALALGLAAMVLGSYVAGPVSNSSTTLLLTFILGVGTDYSVFLMARYREELQAGVPSRQAVVDSVAWAGHSVAISGATVVLATLAMSFSGASLIEDWGRVLSVGVAIAIVVALTLVPAVLALVGPRIFWPSTGERFRTSARRRQERLASKQTYFHRASRFASEKPFLVIAVVGLLTVPVVYLALTAPLDYGYVDQLPPSAAPSQGLAVLSHNFGAGAAFPLEVLLTFPAPLLAGGSTPNAQEWGDVANLTDRINGTAGVAGVDSPVGPAGAPLATWLAYPQLPTAVREDLTGALTSYVGQDGSSVLLTVTLTSNGNSNAAVVALQAIQASVDGYAADHPEVGTTYYGGAPPLTEDLQVQLAQATQRMVVTIVLGLLLVLLVALGSALLPPLAVITIGISAAWAWAITYLVWVKLLGLSLFFYIPSVMFLLVMGLGMDYNVFLLTRVHEERLKDPRGNTAVEEAVAHTGGIITAAAVILGGAFLALTVAQVTLLRVLGFAVGISVIIDAMMVRTYLVPALLAVAKDKAWWGPRFLARLRPKGREVAGGSGPAAPP